LWPRSPGGPGRLPGVDYRSPFAAQPFRRAAG
jgi:hypothetical protein